MSRDGTFSGMGARSGAGGLTGYFQRKSAALMKSEVVPLSQYSNKTKDSGKEVHRDSTIQKVGNGLFFFPQPPTSGGKRVGSGKGKGGKNRVMPDAMKENVSSTRNTRAPDSARVSTKEPAETTGVRPRSTPSKHGHNNKSEDGGTGDPQKRIQQALKELQAVKKRAKDAVAATAAITSEALASNRSDANPLERFQKAGKSTAKNEDGGDDANQNANPVTLKEKLRAAEKVMKNLYARNMELEGQLLDVIKTDKTKEDKPSKAEAVVPEADVLGEKLISSLGANIKPEAMPALEKLSTSMHFDNAQENHIKYLLKQRDDRISQLELYIRQLQEKVTWSTSRMEKLQGQVTAAEAAQRKAGILNENTQRYQERYQSLLEEHRAVLSKKARNIVKMSTLSSEARSLINQLEAQLNEDAIERQIEQAMLNSKLFESEQQKCDWYVERKLMQQDIERLNKDIATRDELESQIETCLAGVFQRLREVETENGRLREALVASGHAVQAGGKAAEEGS